jgi:putative ABC transport system substrate-binding protein
MPAGHDGGGMRRRELIALTGGAVALGALPGRTRSADKVYRVGFLAIGSKSTASATVDGLTASLTRHGYAVGDNLILETRYADGKLDPLPGLVKELVDIPVDVIGINGYPAALAAKEATQTIPIVLINASDPVEEGLAASYAHPGGNITGVSDMAAELSTKRLQLLSTVVPDMKRVAVLYNAADAGMVARYRMVEAAAPRLDITVQPLGVREPDDFEAAFAAMTKERPDGILMVSDILTTLNRARVFEFAARNKIPAIYEFQIFVRDGGLMSYGAERSETAERATILIDRLLKGAKAADLPIEQPTRFALAVNLKTAKTLDLAIPASILAQADEVIE